MITFMRQEEWDTSPGHTVCDCAARRQTNTIRGKGRPVERCFGGAKTEPGTTEIIHSAMIQLLGKVGKIKDETDYQVN